MSIPSVSLAQLMNTADASARRHAVQQLADVCATWGFAYLTDLPNSVRIDPLFAAAKAFFTLPQEQRLQVAPHRHNPENANTYRGFFPANTKSSTYKEGFELGSPDYRVTHSGDGFDELNQWPTPEPCAGWRDLLERHFTSQLTISLSLMTAFEEHFALPSGYFTDKFQNSLSTLRLLHYPVADHAQDHPDVIQFLTPEHTDSGVLSLLLQDEIGGLQVLAPDDTWVDVTPTPGALVMNIGNLLHFWTDGELRSTTHRVLITPHERYSIPFFLEPDADAHIAPYQPRSHTPGVVYRDYLKEKLSAFVEYQGILQNDDKPLSHSHPATTV